MKTKNIFYLIIGIVFLSILNIYQFDKNRHKTRNLNNLITALGDTLTIEKNKNNQYVSSITALTNENVRQFLSLKVKDKEIQDLQNSVKQYKKKIEALTQFTSQLRIDTVTNTIIEYRDKDSFPVYKWNFKDNWINLNGTSSKDNTQFSLKVTEKYDVAIYTEKKQIKVDVINYNPYSMTTGVQSFYKTKPRQKRVGVGPYIGYGYNINQKFGFEIGIGINYNLFYLW